MGPPALRYAVQGCAALRRRESNCLGLWGGKEGEGIGQSTGEWHFTLGERSALARRIFSRKEATEMSRDIKYIGMDVHQEAIVIAVLNGSGKLVMETILETKASSIVQFLRGLRGELQPPHAC